MQIRDDDKKPGLFRWHNERIEVLESCGSVNLTVLRTMGLAGEVSNLPQHPAIAPHHLTDRFASLPPCVYARCAPVYLGAPLAPLAPLAPSYQVSINYATKDQTATAGKDYKAQSGTLTFAHGQVSQSLTIEIIDDDIYEKDETFTVVLSEPTGGAKFDRDTDGGANTEVQHPGLAARLLTAYCIPLTS